VSVGHCKECGWWGREIPRSVIDEYDTDGLDDFRVCETLSHEEDVPQGPVAYFACEEDPDEFCTRPDFGCVLFVPMVTL